MTQEDYDFPKYINTTYLEGPFDLHLVQTSKDEVNVYDHGKYLFKTKFPKVDFNSIDNVKELKHAREKEIIRLAKKKLSDVQHLY